MLSRLRLVCFDLDNTLWPVDAVIVAAEQALHDWLHVHHPTLAAASTPASLRAERMALAAAHPAQAHDLTWLRIETLARLAAAHGMPADIGRQGFEIFIEARHRVEFYPDVWPALDLLASSFRLATLSNGNADLRRLGCAHRFEFNLTAGAIGVAKPDPRAFAKVLELSGCSADEVIYVGDEPHYDIAGPQKIGMRTAWLKRDPARAWPEAVAPPDLVLDSLADLVRALSAAR